MVEWSEQSICRERGFGLDKVPVDGATSMGSPSVAMSVPRTIVDFEPPHLVSLVLNGQVEEAQLAEAFDRIEIYVGALPYYQLEIQLDGVHGATPEARRLAAEGARFTDFYVSQPVCSASRGACRAAGAATRTRGCRSGGSTWSRRTSPTRATKS